MIERSTGTTDVSKGVTIALGMLDALETELEAARVDLLHSGSGTHAPVDAASANTAEAEPKTHRQRGSSKMGEKTRREILAAAMQEFASKGYSGARVDDIVANTSTTKPMVYYHFGSKEKLYAAVMEAAYGGTRNKERDLRLDELPPKQALQKLIEVTFEHHAEHPEYVRLISVENIEM